MSAPCSTRTWNISSCSRPHLMFRLLSLVTNLHTACLEHHNIGRHPRHLVHPFDCVRSCPPLTYLSKGVGVASVLSRLSRSRRLCVRGASRQARLPVSTARCNGTLLSFPDGLTSKTRLARSFLILPRCSQPMSCTYPIQ
ncbi:uncharacterized protein P174DRAFT_296277 [Aspergillus novofumigatus IBT 16806]|uniref:Uncharacterized protein n=1 Tax=Aspergillus novofumigatus (strain IBT 16806) TaxID=1392255 RepID=A0A2I1BYC6_ASPN1|nr:uncharacterized protein P174DRAFT_296277 [Aspergillus novofumigatus IBT 16806]PKX90378.1 hypothetical protein P174DRAFT_296277 [Aspergillus novofumigatus IBT 16806]